MRVLLTGMSGAGKSTLVRELRRLGHVAYDADDEQRTGNAYGRDPAERAQILDDLATIEPMLRRSADLILVTTAPPARLAETLLAHVDRLQRNAR